MTIISACIETLEQLNDVLVIERTFGWFRHFPRHYREYEHTIVSEIATMQCASIALMLNKL